MREGLSDVELLVLGLISTTPLHGHMINRIIAVTPLGRALHVAGKHVYYVLRQLDTAGYVTFRIEKPPSAPARKVYSATPAGLELLAADIVRTDRLESSDGTGFSIVFGLLPYAAWLTDEMKTALVRARHGALTHRRATEYSDDAREFVLVHGGEPVVWAWELERARLDAELDWLERLLMRLGQSGWNFAPPASADYVGEGA
jgi:DNA-binding PadR family transcriptional regulator